MLFKSPKVAFLQRKTFSSYIFLFRLSDRAFKTSLNFPQSPFSLTCKALWGDEVRWLLNSHAVSKFAAKCRIALLLSVVFKLKIGKRIPKFVFTSFWMMWQYDELGFMLLEGGACPKLHICVESTSKSIALKSVTSRK